jgi:hypothetical protein
MSMVGTDGTPVVDWRAFADPWQPTSVDSEPYRAWYAIAREDYNEVLACLHDITHPAEPGSLAGLEREVDLMTRTVADMRATALNIMCTRHEAVTQAIIQEKLSKHAARASK